MNKRKLKKVLVLFMMISSLLLFSCKKTRTDVEWINDGIEMISDEIDLDDASYIKAIRTLYDGLTEKEKTKIKDYQKLLNAEEKIYNLKKENGIIIELKYTLDVTDVKLKLKNTYEDGYYEGEKTIPAYALEDFLLELGEVCGERETRSGANKDVIYEITIGEDKIVYYEDSNYFIFNDNTYSIIDGDFKFLFKYWGYLPSEDE